MTASHAEDPTSPQRLALSSADRDAAERVAQPVVSQTDMIRLVAAVALTVTLLPYAWAYNLVGYSRWKHTDRKLVMLLVAGLIAVIALNFGLSKKLRSKRTAMRIFAGVLVLWSVVGYAVIFLRNGLLLPDWVVFAGFFPATLWLVWAAWMFLLPIRWSVRIGVLAVLLLGIIPFLKFFEGRDLTGDVRVNFAFKWQKPADALVTSSVGELTHGVKLASDPHDFPGFQGPARTAVLPDAHLDSDWKTHPPRELWRVPVGLGWSGFAIAGGFAFTQEQRGDDECVVCRDLSKGNETWVHKDKAPFGDKSRYDGMGGPGPRCTPVIDNGRVYTIGATGILNCLDGATGHALWAKNIVDDNGGHVAGHGVCGSPLVVKEMVIVSPTGKANSSLAAYERTTGKKLWAAGHDAAGYATPMLTTVAGTPQILNYTERGVNAHDPDKGTVLWHFDWTNDQFVVCSEPLANAGAPDRVLLTVGYGKGSVLLKVAKSADGAWTATPLWTSRNMKTKFTTAVIHDSFVYGLDDGILQCIDLETGEQKWKKGRYQHGQILLVGDLLIVQTEAGPVVLVEPNPRQLTELGTIPALAGKTWNCPALAGRLLLVRNDAQAACYELPLRENQTASR